MVLHAVRIDLWRVAARRVRIRHQRRVVPQKPIVEIEVRRIEPETVHASVQPEADRRQHSFLNFRVMEIEIGLRRKEIVQVILPADPIPLPARAAED
ncbi:hypothetical protein BMJ19_36730 [Sinorhizobium medicae]|nr:hypothetical protein BMJ19_36730 [Sinorhizobium medicae]